MIFAPSSSYKIEQEPKDGTIINSTEGNDNTILISKDKWSTLSLDQLLDQRTIINEKYNFLKSHNYEWANKFEELYNEIDAYIATIV